jgi:hypothetical protein
LPSTSYRPSESDAPCNPFTIFLPSSFNLGWKFHADALQSLAWHLACLDQTRQNDSKFELQEGATMKRSINRWTMSLATAGVLALPVTSFARASQEPAPQQQQQPQPEQPPAQPPAQPQPDRPQQPPTDPQPQPTPPQPQPAQPQPTQPTQPQTPQPTTSAAGSTSDQAVSPQEHLRQAQDALKAISTDSVPAKNRSDLGKLKQHLSNLEKMGSSPSASTAEGSPASAGKSASAPKDNWGTEVAAIDKIITEMMGSETATTATSTPGATGTSGKSSTAIDEATRAKLMEVRTHITAYAAGMAGAPSTPKTEASNTAASTAAATPAAAPTEPSAASSSPASSQQPSATPSSPQNPPASAQNPPSTQPDPNAPAPQPPAAGQQSPAAGQPPASAQAPGSADEAHRHLVTARDALSQLTQLPAATQLNGEARTQVAQLITNFNELIGNPPDWRASYQKVSATLTTLLGPDNSDAEAQGGAPTNTTGATATPAEPATPAAPGTPGAAATPGAVGTAGAATVELDPTIRAKLVEFRRSLNQFEKAAGGGK